MFRIGEFSKIAQVAGSQLRYYDEIGLLKPAKIDEWTGYRYYSAQQLPILNRILALRELGLSLDQIRRMLNDDVSAEEIRGMYALKKAQIEQTIQDEVARLQNIEARLQMINEGEFPEDYEILIKSMPKQPYLSVREVFSSFDSMRRTMAELQRALPPVVGQKHLGHFTAILHNEAFETSDVDVELGFTTTNPVEPNISLSGDRPITLRYLPPVETMITTVRIGNPQSSHQCRTAVAAWVEANDYQFIDTCREVFIVPPQPGREDQTVLEVQYPIAKIESVNLLPADLVN